MVFFSPTVGWLIVGCLTIKWLTGGWITIGWLTIGWLTVGWLTVFSLEHFIFIFWLLCSCSLVLSHSSLKACILTLKLNIIKTEK